MSLAKKLGITAVGIAVAAGADCGLAQNLYDVVNHVAGVDPHHIEEVIRAAGTATALGAGGSAFYEGMKESLKNVAQEGSKLPKYAAALGLAGIVALAADSNMARDVYDMLMLYHFNLDIVTKTVTTVASAGVIGAGIGSLYYGVKDLVGWLGKKFKKSGPKEKK